MVFVKGQLAHNKRAYPSIPDLCHCGCGEVVYCGARYKHGHYIRVINPSYKGKVAWNRGIKTNKPAWNRGMSCPQHIKDAVSLTNTGNKYAQGHIVSPEIRLQISKKCNDRIPWNKGLKTGKPAKNRGVPHTEIAKLKIANRQYFYGKENANYGHLPSINASHGKRCYYLSPLQGQVCFRSSYELAYAKYLDSISELWMYEMETFDLGSTTYTPDFFLPRREKFIEIKGYMLPKAQEKINQFREQYPWDLEVLGLKELKELKVL